MQRLLVVMVFAAGLAGLAGCATVDKAQMFDGATTWYALSQGYAEDNVLLADLPGPSILALKLTVTQLVKLTPEPLCVPATQALTVTGVAAGIWNLAVMAAAWWAAIPVAAIVVWEYWGRWYQDAWLTCQLPLFAEISELISTEPAMGEKPGEGK